MYDVSDCMAIHYSLELCDKLGPIPQKVYELIIQILQKHILLFHE